MSNKTDKSKIYGEMPHNLEAEQALLGCLLMDSVLQTEVTSSLKEDDFFAPSHKYIFNAMLTLVKSNQLVELVTLVDILEKQGNLEQAGGISYISELANVLPSAANYQRYLEIVLRDSMLRRLIVGAAEIIEESKSSTDRVSALAFAEKTVYDISNSADTSTMVKIGSVLPTVMNMFDELSNDKSSFKGVKTKFRGLDKILNGLHGSDLIVLAARPAVGKTSLAMNIVANVASQGYACAVFSLEMGKEQLVQRMICSVAGVSMERALKGEMTKTDWLKINKAREILKNSKIFIDDSAAVTPQELLSKCRRLQRKHGLDLVMVDYIQLMSAGVKSKADNRQQEITEISRNLKIMAKELNVPVIALSQLSRQVETRKGRPVLADLRESGAIEQDADIVMFIHRPDKGASEKELAEGKVKANVAEIIIEKHRNGPTGMVNLYFNGETTTFLNYNSDTGEVEGEKENNVKKPVVSNEYEDLPDRDADKTSEKAVVQQGEEEQGEQVPKSIDEEMFD